jgi:hypothetical protein
MLLVPVQTIKHEFLSLSIMPTLTDEPTPVPIPPFSDLYWSAFVHQNVYLTARPYQSANFCRIYGNLEKIA